MSEASARVLRYVGLFAITYTLLLGTFGTIALHFHRPAGGLNTGALVLSLITTGFVLARKLRRTLTTPEYWQVAGGAMLFNAAYQFSSPLLIGRSDLYSPVFWLSCSFVVAMQSVMIGAGFIPRVLERYVPKAAS